ncbi:MULTISPECIES: type II toxin-antitoxin system VapC family toxin [Cyanophyceae]|uniref:Twitching motility protein PilT n=1 Tax=Nodularia spumigena CENA596 TaxID=1819295 RepID=A0A166KHP5_NODSP|nr:MULTISPECIES: type II toxin-antitoxin system VapC family toxin [Cyanophyceae]MDB9355001.1 type II toxin-antitoxin system VapC family toxin [Nodularia spumigena CS-587/03]KZL51139.1 twitching motility protein PilT [Nodularia spumigena CENA596]MDB9305962.1 type II toxin-antitoxin system VapC family toxin [Nodularia spumigena CS-591/12]MDB9316516.1 type II toxin-antitoxin system VapC family toxin [Nodularia spumigena CS-590/01A]MDB9323432.1 type II toxin-antitoxin system VapC family toxin [Nod
MSYLLDSNIVSYILKKNATVDKRFREVRRLRQDVFISCITYYEVKRGLLAINASRQLAEFQKFCQIYQVLLIDDLEIIERACEIHLDLQRRGFTIQEQDIFIAATAITRGLILVSNDSDLLRVQGINLENWAKAES